MFASYISGDFLYEQNVSLLSGDSREIVGLMVSLLYCRTDDTISTCFHCPSLTPALKPGCLSCYGAVFIELHEMFSGCSWVEELTFISETKTVKHLSR